MQVAELKKVNPEEELNNIQRKKIKDVVTELLTPVQLELKVDMNSLKKKIEECSKTASSTSYKLKKIERDFEDRNKKLTRDLKNSDVNSKVLDRELTRLQHVDRLKVLHAKDSFYNPDTGKFLPSLDTA